MPKVYHAFFSKKACDEFGFVIYERENGEKVVCTAVGEGRDFYQWDDAVYLGLVSKWMSTHKKNQ